MRLLLLCVNTPIGSNGFFLFVLRHVTWLLNTIFAKGAERLLSVTGLAAFVSGFGVAAGVTAPFLPVSVMSVFSVFFLPVMMIVMAPVAVVITGNAAVSLPLFVLQNRQNHDFTHV